MPPTRREGCLALAFLKLSFPSLCMAVMLGVVGDAERQRRFEEAQAKLAAKTTGNLKED